MATFADQVAAQQAAGISLGGITPAATPAPSPAPSPGEATPPATTTAGAQPSGATPNAKRPRGRAEDENAMAIQPPAPVMTLEELTSGFHALHAQVQKNAGHSDEMNDSVSYNSALLNALILRVNAAEASASLSNAKIQEVTSGIENLDLSTAQLAEDAKKVF